MVERIKISQEKTKKPILPSVLNNERKSISDKDIGVTPKLNLSKKINLNETKIVGSGKINKVIKLSYGGLMTKVVNKFAKRGKNTKGEENLVKALKKVDLSIKKSKGVQDLSNELILAKINSLTSSTSASLKTGNPSFNQIESSTSSITEFKNAESLSSNENKTSNEVRIKDSSVSQNKGKSLSLIKGKSEGLPSSTFSAKSKLSLLNTKLPSGLGLLANIIQKAKPLVRLKKVRVAGITHQKPIPLTKKQAETEAIKRILLNAITRSEKSASVRLAKEFEEIYNLSLSNKTLTEIRDLHKAADANKANLGLK